MSLIIVHSPRCWSVDVLRSAPLDGKEGVVAGERDAPNICDPYVLSTALYCQCAAINTSRLERSVVASERYTSNGINIGELSGVLTYRYAAIGVDRSEKRVVASERRSP
jgi:hypothetical protein